MILLPSHFPLFFSCSTVTERSRLSPLPNTFHSPFLNKSKDGTWRKITSAHVRTNELFKTKYQDMFLHKLWFLFSSVEVQFHMNGLADSLQVIEKFHFSSSTTHLFLCFTLEWFFFGASYHKPFAELNCLIKQLYWHLTCSCRTVPCILIFHYSLSFQFSSAFP